MDFFNAALLTSIQQQEEEKVNPQKRLEEAETYAREQGLTRKERRHLLAVTDGRRGHEENTKSFEGIREAMVKRDFQRQVAIKHNLVNTLRLRNQVPI